jgi:hypothetical protein
MAYGLTAIISLSMVGIIVLVNNLMSNGDASMDEQEVE